MLQLRLAVRFAVFCELEGGTAGLPREVVWRGQENTQTANEKGRTYVYCCSTRQ